MSSIKEKTVKGISWNLIESILNNIIRFVIGIVLARLLSPNDFGIIAIVTVFFTISEVFINGGFGQAYIQKKTVTSTDADTVFIINLSISILIYLILWISAPYIANFYRQEELVDIIHIMGIIIVVNSFNIIQVSQMRRLMAFKRKAIVTMLSLLISGTFGVILAYIGFGVWSLVFQQISNRVLVTIGLYFSSDWRFKFRFSKDSFNSLFALGGWLLIANIFKTLFDNLYRLIIGRFFSTVELGLFSKARQFEGMVSQQFSWAVGMVSFPVLSQSQNNKKELNSKYSLFLKYVTLITFPSLTILIVVSDPLILFLLTEKWVDMIPYLKLVCFIGMLTPIYDLNMQTLQSIGKGKLVFNLSLIRNVLRIVNVSIVYSLKLGLTYIIIGEITLLIITLLINSFYTKKYFIIGIKDNLRIFGLFIVGSAVSGIVGYLVVGQFTNNILQIVFGTISSLSIYTACIYIFNRKTITDLFSLKNIIFKKS